MRLPVVSSDEMTDEQRDLYREILGGPRGQGPRAVLLASGAGGLAGPFNAMLYAPPVGHALQGLGVAILVVAQAWDSAYERASHELVGRDAGLTDEEIEALNTGADPGFAAKDEQVAYAVVRALTSPDADLDDEQYDTAISVLGQEALVELSSLVGYYATLALQLRIFRVPAP
jgi:4-carboxymuconolactone decarboxylase